ncbi:coil containing protein [Vibrio phage 1.275.O._10N.286.54.E11]|nr:coil containing protein [Vibrio phage 1.275.O._10N.286.54.E11]
MANPFYQPVQNQVAPALSNLTNTIQGAGQLMGQRREYEAEQARKAEAQAEIEQGINDLNDAFQNEDYDKLAELSIKYPQMGEQVTKMLGAKTQRTKANAIDTLSQLYLNPESAEQILGDREQLVLSEGGDPVDTKQFLETYRTNPEEAIRMTKGYLAMTAPDKYKAVSEAVAVKPLEYTNIKEGADGRYIGINSKTGRFEEIPGDYESKGKAKKLKEVSGGVKYYEDGTEEPIGGNESVTNPKTGKRFTKQQGQAVLADAKEFQLKNGGFAVTLDDGLTKIDQMYKEGYDPSKAAWISSVFGDGTLPSRTLMSADDQVFFGSIDQMINAIARRETGAAITEFERQDFFNRYMPRSNDKPKRIKQKRDALERQFKSIAGQSGGVYEALKITGEDEPAQEPTGTGTVIKWDDL